MTDLEIVTTCPLGSKCREIKDGKIHQCAWFNKFAGTNPNTGETVDEWGCAIVWQPILLVENSRQQNSTAAAIESFRNEMVKANEVSQQIMLASSQLKLSQE